MNVDRRATARVCIELIKECSEVGEMADTSHEALVDAVKAMQQAEYWSLRNQAKHEGKNESTDKQLAISRVALPALEEAVKALEADDYAAVIAALELAITTDGSPAAKPKRKRKPRD